jgi:hypothetical protein
MLTHKFAVGLVGITAAVVGAVAMARSSTDTNINSLSKAQPQAQPFAAKCPMIDWPYGCRWRPTAQSEAKHLSVRKSGLGHLHTSFLGKRVR